MEGDAAEGARSALGASGAVFEVEKLRCSGEEARSGWSVVSRSLGDD